MKSNSLIVLTILALTLAACNTTSAPTVIPTVILNSQPVATSNNISASGEVVPVQKAQLSFPLVGVVESVAVKAGDQVTAGQTLVVLDTGILEARVKEAEADLTATQTQVRYLRRIGTDDEHLQSAQADVDRAQASLDSANATLARATLTAPFDGTIASVEISPAETVVPGQVVIQMGDLSHLQIETTDLSERDVSKVKVGQVTAVSVEALNQKFTGRVTDISRISSKVGGDVVYKVTVALDAQPQGLLWGMTTNVEIETGK
jgi:macrolide-specific efflux system membrane fusion protein